MIRCPSVRVLGLCIIFIVLLGLQSCSTTSNKSGVTADPEWQRLMLAGHETFKQSRFEKAAEYYQNALLQAQVMDNSLAISDAAYSLAACYIRLGKYDSAKNLLKEARDEPPQYQVGNILLLEAKVARMQKHFDEAWSLTEQLLNHLSSYPSDELSLQVYLLRGHIALDQDKLVRAESEFKKANTYSGKVSSPLLLAGYSGFAGRIYLRKNRPEMAAKEFDKETRLLKEAEQYHEMVLSLENAADTYKITGDYLKAANRFIRAARSAFAQGNKMFALELGQKSLSAANTANDRIALSRAQRFLDEIE